MSSPRLSLRILLLWLAGGAVVVVLALFGLAGSGARNGRLAPQLPKGLLSGRPVTLSALRGHPALVTFWASWCQPCQREAPALERFSRGLAGHATLVGVNWSDPSLAEARKFTQTYGWTFPNLRDPQGSAGLAYGVTGLPTTFAIDSRGRVRATLRGPQTQQALTGALAIAGG